MPLFHAENPTKSDRHAQLYARFEIAYTFIDFSAAVCFVIGSIMFFYPAWEIPGVWMFLVGSILFGVKPTLRLIREIRLVALGDAQDVADKLDL